MRMIVAALALLWVAGGEGVVVDVTGGAVLGAEETSAGGRRFFAFRHVPFAASPEADGRFKPPRPVHPWRGVLISNVSGPVCAQAGRGVMVGQEDCLHLSVYTPHDLESEQSLPVLVWLHGGAFIVSGASDIDPRLLMDRDVVLVVPQYRLGFLGFIYAFDPAPGNYGLLDQVAALQWVQQNIGQFGGDPSRVTLAGDCAGGASALYHMISPASVGLFHRVVSVSGTPLDVWTKHPALRRTMVAFADALRCPRSALSAMVNCFIAAPLELLLNTQGAFLERHDILIGNAYLAPAVQSRHVSDESAQFLLDEPLTLLTHGNFTEVPVLLVTSKNQGNYIVGMTLYEWLLTMRDELDDDFNDVCIAKIVKALGFIPGGKEERLIRQQYLTGLRDTSLLDKLPALAELLGDALYNTGTLFTARLLSKKVPTRILRFDFEDGPHRFNHHPDLSEKKLMAPGAGHLDPLNYFLPKHVEEFETKEQQRISFLMLDIIENFMNGREPTVSDLPQVTAEEDVECAVVNRNGFLTQDSFLPPERAAAARIFFEKHHVSALYQMGMPPPRDEL
ncbi:carboxylesterase-like [Hyalella azteca]|nr:carboxylesterase-like [Hyalella azteca]